MGIDITMAMGFGVHLTQSDLNEWLVLDDDYGAWEAVEDLVAKYPLITYSSAGNSWSGEDNGFVLYAKSTYRDFDMGRGAEAGVYRGSGTAYTGEEEIELNQASVEVVGRIRPIEWLVTVGVS